jgi:triacylglycerol lipase
LGVPKACGKDLSRERNIYVSFSGTGAAQTTNPLDPDTLLTSMGYVAFSGQKNDGLVSQCSSRLGKTIRDNLFGII